MSACLCSAGDEGLQEKGMEEVGAKAEAGVDLDVDMDVDVAVAGEADLTGSAAGDDKVRKKKRLDARRSKQTRAKTRTRSPEDMPTEDQCPNTHVGRLGCGTVDPFGSLPYLAYGDTDVLAHHYNTVFAKTTTPPGNRGLWFSFALTDPALFHTTLFISASHLSAVRKKAVLPAFFQHRGEVIRIVNSRLRKNEAGGATDATIGAIAGLSVTDSLAGHPERVRAHIDGLQQLIAARGGVEMLTPLVAELVGWVDMLASISLQAPPFFRTRLQNPNLRQYYRPPSSSTASYAGALTARLRNFTNSPEASSLVGSIYWGLRNVTLDREIENEVHHSSSGIQFSDRTETLEREIQKLIHDVLPPVPSPPSDSSPHVPDPHLVVRLFAYASLIYVGLVLRDLLDNVLMKILAQRLELSMDIDDSELNVLLGTFPDLMLWVLFLGGGTARSRSKVWFARTAARILRIRKISELEGIQEAATRFLWPEGRENYDPTLAEEEEENVDLEMIVNDGEEPEEERVGLEALSII